MAVPSLPADVTTATTGSSTHMNSMLDLLGFLRDDAPVFRGQAYSNNGASQIDVSTATSTTFGFGGSGSFVYTPEINVGSWTVQGSDANPESLVVPEAGIYWVTVNARWEADATGSRVAVLVINGSVDNDIYSGTRFDSASFTAGNNAGGLIDVAAGAQLDVNVWQNSGSTLEATVTLSATWVRST